MFRKGKKRLLLILCLIGGISIFIAYNTLAISISSKPQTKKSEHEKDLPSIAYSADLRIGPFKIQPSFSLKNMGYDSNIFSSPSNPVADYTATPTAGLRSIVLLGNRGFLSFGGELGYLWFYQTTSQNFLNRYADAHLEINFSRLSLYIEESFSNERERYGNEIDLRTRQTTNNAAFGIKYEPSRKTSLAVGFSQDLLRYDSEATYSGYQLGEILNHQKTTGILTFGYQMLPKTRALIELNYGENNFENTESDLNSTSYKAMIGAEFDASAFIQGIFKLGYKYLVFTSSDIESYQGLTGSANIRYRIFDRLSFLFSFNRDTYFSYFSQYYISDLYGGLITFYLSNRIGIDLGSSIITNKYPLREAVDNDTFFNQITLYHLGFKYRLKEDLSTGISGGYRTRQSNTGINLEGFTLFSTISYDF